LPIIEGDLDRLPEDVERDLHDAFGLQVRYHQPTRRVIIRVTIDGEAIPRLAAASHAIKTLTRPSRQTTRPRVPEANEDRDFPLQVVPRQDARRIRDNI
jgi:hypothetical protein